MNFQEMPLKSFGNINLIEFISAFLNVLASNEKISTREVEDFRVAVFDKVNTLQSSSWLLHLTEYEKSIIEVLCLRYGDYGLTSNLLRYSIKPQLYQIKHQLSQWGLDILDLVKQNYNQPFEIYNKKKYDHKRLFSEVLTELADRLSITGETIAETLNELDRLVPNKLSALDPSRELEIDLKIAKALGFGHVDDAIFFVLKEAQAIKKSLLSVRDLIEYLGYLKEQASQKVEVEEEEKTTFLLSKCDHLILRLLSLDLKQRPSLEVFEEQRLDFVGGLSEFTDAFAQLFKSFQLFIKQFSSNIRSSKIDDISRAAQRGIAFDLVAHGIKVSDAQKASEDLITYAKNLDLQPERIIVAELNRINQLLTVNSLRLMQNFCKQSVALEVPIKEKQKVLSKVNILDQNFKKRLIESSNFLSMLLLLVALVGCGLKAKPTSEAIDFRPQIPQHATH